ncbi:MAG: hypothetical protein AAF639_09955 [Chloroflexota bacterium]
MAYSSLTLDGLQREFGLIYEHRQGLFSSFEAVEISAHLTDTLDENIPLAVAINTEKARSELIISNMLVELRKQFDRKITFFSGIDFEVDKDKGLNGYCDFIVSLSPQVLFLNMPVIAFVEAKNHNPITGLAQCIGEMVGAQIYNQKNNTPLDTIYGSISTGTGWMFLKLIDKTVYIDLIEYNIEQPGRIIGILSAMLKQTA